MATIAQDPDQTLQPPSGGDQNQSTDQTLQPPTGGEDSGPREGGAAADTSDTKNPIKKAKEFMQEEAKRQSGGPPTMGN